MPRSNSSARWLNEHFNDPYVKRAQQAGYRSRAAFKLLEIQEKDKLLHGGMTVVDLGAAPGGWSGVAKKIVGAKGRVLALDILPMDPLTGVEFLQADFNNEQSVQQLLQYIDNCPVDLVMSDMAPNISGITAIDQPRSINLAEQALIFSERVLKPGGHFLVKAFQGAGFEQFYQDMRGSFSTIKIRKPKASRSRSNEVYLLGLGYKPK
jgi:23S rRNA (uridine2552-2'-O)-methyltransferase